MRRGEKLNGRRVARGSREGLENPGSYCRSGGRVRERREKALDLESELDPPPFLATPSFRPSLQISKRVLDGSHFLSSSFLPPPGLQPHPSVLRSLYPRKGVSGFARLPRTLLPFPLPRGPLYVLTGYRRSLVADFIVGKCWVGDCRSSDEEGTGGG